MKPFLRNIILSILIVLAIFFSSTIWINKDKIIWLDDGLRHLTFSNIIDKYWFEYTYEHYNLWDIITNSILTDYRTDLWQGFHVLLVWMIKLWIQDLDVLKLYYSLIFWIVFFVFVSISDKLKLPFYIPSTLFILFILNDFIYRIFLARPFMLSVILYALLTLSLQYKKHLRTIILLILWTLLHSVFYLLIFPIFLYLIFYRPSRKIRLKLIIYGIIWIWLWLLLHYNWINYLKLSFLHTFAIPYIQFKEWFGSGEAQGIGFDMVFSLSFLLPLTTALVYFFIWYANQKEKIFSNNKELNFMLIHLLILFLLMWFYGRFMDYFNILAYFSIPFFIYEINKFKWIDFNLNISKTKYVGLWGLILFFCFGTVNMFYDKNATNIKKITSIIQENKSEIKEWSHIITYKHLQFPILFYALGEKYKYNCSMEPIFFYLKDKEKFIEYKDTLMSYMLKPKKYKDSNQYEVLRNYDTQYLIHFGEIEEDGYLSSELLKIKIDKIKNDDRFRLISEKDNNFIWQLKQ